MAQPLTYAEINLACAGQTIALRPSLGCAITLERLHDGFPALITKITEFDTATIKAVIRAAAPKKATRRFLKAVAGHPLGALTEALQAPLMSLVAALLPDAADSNATGKSVPWNEAFSNLFGIATGWLGWSYKDAWHATPAEIMAAFSAHTDKLKAIHGGGDDDDNPAHENTEQQRAENEALGLDPELDRAGLVALKHLQRRMR